MNIAKKISNKIEEIRREPEHVRIRWVWTYVIFSMLIIVAIWIFSMTSLFQGDKKIQDAAQTPGINEQLQELKQQAPSLKDLSDQTLTIGNEGISNSPVKNSEERPAPTQPELPQASGYSDLPGAQTGQ